MAIEEYCEELDSVLAADNEAALGLDEIHGFMSAALCGPRVVSFKDCVCAAFLPEGEDAEESECELSSRLMELLGLLYEDTQRSIDDGSFLPLVSCAQDDDDDAEEEIDAQQWCCGFLMGMEHSRSRWKLDNNRVLDLLAPIVLLADPGEFEQAAGQMQEISIDEFRQELLESLPDSVCAFKKFFKKAPRPRRTAGSGKPSSGKRR